MAPRRKKKRGGSWQIALGVFGFLVLVALVGLLGSHGTSSSPPTNDTSLTADPEADPSATPPQTTTKLAVAKAPVKCGDPHARVYNPDRLQLLSACVTVKGIVEEIRSEKDGDLHVLLQLDAGQSKYLNSKNTEYEQGWLVLEPVCVDAPTQADAVSACAGYTNPLPIPAVGVHVAATGAWVLDLDHGWMEIHPVYAFNGVGSPPVAAAAPSSKPPPPPVNLCGAPQNPWKYTFCAGHLIYSPASAFCSYFRCISSFWNGTGYVVQCADGTYSKSGGHTGVCSYHGGPKRNLYSP